VIKAFFMDLGLLWLFHRVIAISNFWDIFKYQQRVTQTSRFTPAGRLLSWMDVTESEVISVLQERGPLTVAFITRFLYERGFVCTRQKVERILRSLVERGVVEAFYINGNKRKHYRLAR